MNDRPTTAGGFFLILAILAGFGIGIYEVQALLGTVIGTAVGTAIAVAVWLKDRKRVG